MAEMSARADPFDVAKDEVAAAMRKVQFMHKEWTRLLETQNTSESRQFQDLHGEIGGELQQLEYDVQELNSSIAMVEEHRDQFAVISDSEIKQRRKFVETTRASLKEVKDSISSQKTMAKLEADRKKLLMAHTVKKERQEENRAAQQAEASVDEQRMLQRQLIQQQDEELHELSNNTKRIGHIAQQMNCELESQSKMLDDLNVDIEAETARMGVVMKGMGKALQTSNKWQISAIAGLVGLFFVLLTLFIWT